MDDQTMKNSPLERSKKRPFGLPLAVLAILPLILLGAVILLFINTSGGLQFRSPVPIEDLSIERTVLTPGHIELVVRNGSPQDLTIAQVIINDAIWPMSVTPAPTIPRLGKANVHLDYMWVAGEAYAITLFTSNAIPFTVDIPAAVLTPQQSLGTFVSYTLIGLYVGIIPVYLGLAWFPVLRQLGRKWMIFLLAATIGLLIFLGLDTLVEALEQAGQVPGPLQGIGLVGIGAVGTFFLLEAISHRQASIGRSEESQRLSLALMIAVGIGLHNLGEGLAIGAAYNVGEIALGAFLVVGFIIQNITEGLAIIAPILRDRPGLRQLAMLGFIGGFPAVLGAWIGGFAPNPTLAVLFLAVGTGAIFEVAYEILRLIRKDTAAQSMPVTVFSGVVVGMLLLWVTGLLIK